MNIIMKTSKNAKLNESQLFAVKPHLGHDGSKKKIVIRIPRMLVRKNELETGTATILCFRVDTNELQNSEYF